MDRLPPLRNAWFALRHGRSEANALGIIVSRPERAVAGFGLSPEGAREVEEKLAPARLAPLGLAFGPADTECYSSDFRRAAETAELFCRLNSLAPPRLDPRLRERGFGDLEGAPNTAYERIWAADRRDPGHREHGCESLLDVRARLLDLVLEIDRGQAGKRIVLVSHGDPLQILETTFRGWPVERHRDLPHLETGEIRRLT